MSNQKMCPLLAAGIMASPSDRMAEKIQAGWDRCQGIDCQWWDTEQGECLVVPKWMELRLLTIADSFARELGGRNGR